jgi:hypothetical protein
MFVDESGRNELSLERTFHRCFLPSFTSFGWAVSEEKIKMWKVNGRRTPSDGKSSHCLWQGELKIMYINSLIPCCSQYKCIWWQIWIEFLVLWFDPIMKSMKFGIPHILWKALILTQRVSVLTWVSEWLFLCQVSNFSAKSWQEQITFQRNDDVHFILY